VSNFFVKHSVRFYYILLKRPSLHIKANVFQSDSKSLH